jgi:TIR domain
MTASRRQASCHCPSLKREKERLAAEQREKERLEAEQGEKERLKAERREGEWYYPPASAPKRGGWLATLMSRLQGRSEAPIETFKPTAAHDLLNELASGRHPKEVSSGEWAEHHPVDCTVFAPDRVERRQSALLQVFLHTPDDRVLAEATALKFDRGTKERGHRSLVLDAPIGTIFSFDVEVDGFVFSERVGTLLWTGQPQSVAFPFTVTPGCKLGQHAGTVRIWKDGTPVGIIRFQIEAVRFVAEANQKPVGDEARRYRSCFCSYSSRDRVEMLKRAQGLQASGLETFIDVLNLRPSDKWDPKILAAIDNCDLFVLIWSTNALHSKWVKKESRYALRRYKSKGSPDFRPIPVEGPPIPPVPRGLRDYHFNDALLTLIRAAEVEASARS